MTKWPKKTPGDFCKEKFNASVRTSYMYMIVFLGSFYLSINIINSCLLFYSKILKPMILWFVISEFGTYVFFLSLWSWPIRVKNVRQIGTVDVTRCIKPSSHHVVSFAAARAGVTQCSPSLQRRLARSWYCVLMRYCFCVTRILNPRWSVLLSLYWWCVSFFFTAWEVCIVDT